MTHAAIPLATVFAVALTGTTAFAGGVPIIDSHYLQFAPSSAQELVTRDIAPQSSICVQPDSAANLSPDHCGTISKEDMAKLKTAQDD